MDQVGCYENLVTLGSGNQTNLMGQFLHRLQALNLHLILVEE
jgi:hypothetical protein